jgi:hypothetical protein
LTWSPLNSIVGRLGVEALDFPPSTAARIIIIILGVVGGGLREHFPFHFPIKFLVIGGVPARSGDVGPAHGWMNHPGWRRGSDDVVVCSI